jgi:hypothetical protein
MRRAKADQLDLRSDVIRLIDDTTTFSDIFAHRSVLLRSPYFKSKKIGRPRSLSSNLESAATA